MPFVSANYVGYVYCTRRALLRENREIEGVSLYLLRTCVPDDDYERGCDVVCAQDGDLVVVRIRHCKLPLEDVEQTQGTHHLGLDGAKGAGRLLEVGKLEEELVEVAGRLLDGNAVDQEDHDDGGFELCGRNYWRRNN